MNRTRKLLSIAALTVATAAGAVALHVPTEAAPIPIGGPDCTIVLCPAPPPTCPPGFKLGVPPGQCCPVCLPSR